MFFGLSETGKHHVWIVWVVCALSLLQKSKRHFCVAFSDLRIQKKRCLIRPIQKLDDYLNDDDDPYTDHDIELEDLGSGVPSPRIDRKKLYLEGENKTKIKLI